MKPKLNYRTIESCLNCKHCLCFSDYGMQTEYFCGASLESRLTFEQYDGYHNQDPIWSARIKLWLNVYRVNETSVCDSREEGRYQYGAKITPQERIGVEQLDILSRLDCAIMKQALDNIHLGANIENNIFETAFEKLNEDYQNGKYDTV